MCLAIFFGVLSCFLVSISHAQKAPWTVIVIKETDTAASIKSGLDSRIGASSRYTVTEASKAEIWVNVNCFTVESVVVSPATRGVDGYICSYRLEYLPQEAKPLKAHLVSGLIAGTSNQVIEDIFEQFVSKTSDEKFVQSRSKLVRDVIDFCASPEHRVYCTQ